jgi:hypothetical protein
LKRLKLILGDKFDLFTLFAFKYIRRIKDKRQDQHGSCEACGVDTTFVFNSLVINPNTLRAWANDETSIDYLKRESLFCEVCGSSFRARTFSKAILSLYTSNACKDLKSSIENGYLSDKDILSVNEIGGAAFLQKLLTKLPSIITTIYEPSIPFGAKVGEYENQDINNLLYPDDTFDVVMHSEVLEHVPNYAAALDECMRVLKPGGKLIFTVPLQLQLLSNIQKFRVENGNVTYKKPKVWHGWAGGPFALIPKRQDFLELHIFGREFLNWINAKYRSVDLFVNRDMEFTSGGNIVIVIQK